MTRSYPLGREATLTKHFALMPNDLNPSREAREKLVAHILAACRRERQRGLDGHWCYDPARHAGMVACYEIEKAALDALT